ncbi:hypothetical protein PanWU01x14_040190 [Parasponia andersonii]|uniref:Uncharacterized protein n=1 Tax=Parasponia andersonii TaxID=3476 RepID=A0A2P5DR63_PARAD|nr:hypothetical protein PanWU01x14_040190 [Parasponia andersonii]
MMWRRETGSRGQERDHADPDTDAEGGGGVGAVEGVVGDEAGVVVEVVVMVVVVVVVEGGGRCDNEDVPEAHHAHLRREAVVDGPRRWAGPHGGGGCGGGSGGGPSIEAER